MVGADSERMRVGLQLSPYWCKTPVAWSVLGSAGVSRGQQGTVGAGGDSRGQQGLEGQSTEQVETVAVT